MLMNSHNVLISVFRTQWYLPLSKHLKMDFISWAFINITHLILYNSTAIIAWIGNRSLAPSQSQMPFCRLEEYRRAMRDSSFRLHAEAGMRQGLAKPFPEPAVFQD